MLASGGWVLFARTMTSPEGARLTFLVGDTGVRFAGAGHIAAGIGVLLSIFPRLAVRLEAAMLAVITILVWVPVVSAQPAVRLNWTAFIISLAITAGAWVVAESLSDPKAREA